jgi:hypothetical protein
MESWEDEDRWEVDLVVVGQGGTPSHCHFVLDPSLQMGMVLAVDY